MSIPAAKAARPASKAFPAAAMARSAAAVAFSFSVMVFPFWPGGFSRPRLDLKAASRDRPRAVSAGSHPVSSSGRPTNGCPSRAFRRCSRMPDGS